jgi:hypothetical protein
MRAGNKENPPFIFTFSGWSINHMVPAILFSNYQVIQIFQPGQQGSPG